MKNQNEAIQLKTEEKIYNLKNDIIFQSFFARKGNEEFLIDFLNALLNKKIKEIEIREEVNLERLSKYEKGGRLDLQAKLEDGTIVSIEMQVRNEYNLLERTTFYSGKIISRETEKGIDYKDINQVIMINILGYNLLEVEDYISETKIVLDKHREYEVLTGVKWYFIELPKFRRLKPDMNEKINQWLALIDDYNKELVKVAENKNETLRKARIEMNYLTGDEEIRRIAQLKEKWEMERTISINNATKIGEKKKSIQIAKKLLKLEMPEEQISEITQLDKEEIQKLISKKQK